MKFNEGVTTKFFFKEYNLEDYGFTIDQEYNYSELETENLHRANFMFFLCSRDKYEQALDLFTRLELFHNDIDPLRKNNLNELEDFLIANITFALNQKKAQNTNQHEYIHQLIGSLHGIYESDYNGTQTYDHANKNKLFICQICNKQIDAYYGSEILNPLAQELNEHG